ncbi:mitochondrial coenzyme A transporter SLC25A42 isoform X2 [Diachasma alloeum]|uniref:mitochondrial coenzyme A transporter SLC25A42 isoform X2 n=1 Tax=Diachasma alloeum TaxID=454923 RepID=UPI0007383F6C|nr:mitochondrial coenzyme A transporter SLC25A42 isoform X2 [Diachasma alloeum]
MSGQIAAGPVEGSKAVLERIHVSVMTGNAKGNFTQDKAGDTEATEHHKTQISNVQRVYTSLLAGAIAGALAKTVIAPLDRTKINFQISKMTYSQKAAIDFLVQSYKKDGLMSLWRGNSATMARIVPYSAIQFAAHEQWKRILRVNGPDTKPINRLVAGSLAGVTSQTLTYPLDMARARMAVTQKAEYSTLRQVFVQIYRNEGILAFYRGFFATILGVIPYAGCSFFTYDTLKNYFKDKEINPGMSTATLLFCGATAGAVGQTASYPLDIVRRRMQTSAVKGAYYHTSVSTAVKIYQEEGIMAFYKGLSMNWVKGPVAVGISFATHDTIRDNLRLYLSG